MNTIQEVSNNTDCTHLKELFKLKNELGFGDEMEFDGSMHHIVVAYNMLDTIAITELISLRSEERCKQFAEPYISWESGLKSKDHFCSHMLRLYSKVDGGFVITGDLSDLNELAGVYLSGYKLTKIFSND